MTRPRDPRRPRGRPRKRAGPSKPTPSAGEAAEASPRIERRERRRQRSREEIAEAARRVILRDGVNATTLDAIAREAGLTKAALYYYYPSKDALLFDLIFSSVEAQSLRVHDAVERTHGGGDALRALISESVRAFTSRMDDFRLTYIYPQTVEPDTSAVTPAQLERLRPLNDLAYGGTAKRLAQDWKKARGRARVEPRMMAFLAGVSALGVLTMKSLVERANDPLLYSDEQLVEALTRIFEAAAAP